MCTALQQNKTLTGFTILGMLCSGVCSVQVIGVRWCKCSGAVITGCWLGRLQFGSGYCGLQHGMLHCNDVTGFGGGSCLPPLPPPHPHTYRGVRERRGLCDFFSWTCGAEAVAYDAPVQYAGEPNALCVMLNCGATHMPEDNNSAWQALMGLGSEHRAAFSCCEGMCSRAVWYAGLSHNTCLCVKRRCVRCLISRPCHGV